MHERTRHVIPIVGDRWDESDDLGFQENDCYLYPKYQIYTILNFCGNADNYNFLKNIVTFTMKRKSVVWILSGRADFVKAEKPPKCLSDIRQVPPEKKSY